MRKIASMKKYLSSNQCKIPIHALVLSSLDYCNSLYYGFNSSNTRQLQTIQNRACIIVYGLEKISSASDGSTGVRGVITPSGEARQVSDRVMTG